MCHVEAHLRRSYILSRTSDPPSFDLAGCVDTPIPRTFDKILKIENGWYPPREELITLRSGGLDERDLD